MEVWKNKEIFMLSPNYKYSIYAWICTIITLFTASTGSDLCQHSSNSVQLIAIPPEFSLLCETALSLSLPTLLLLYLVCHRTYYDSSTLDKSLGPGIKKTGCNAFRLFSRRIFWWIAMSDWLNGHEINYFLIPCLDHFHSCLQVII